MKRICLALLISTLALVHTSLQAFPSYEPFVSITNGTAGPTNGWGTTSSYANGAALHDQTNGFGEIWYNNGISQTSVPVSITNVTLHYTNDSGVSQIPPGFPEPNQCALVPNVGKNSGAGPGATLNFNKVIYPPSTTDTTNKVYVSFLLSVPTTRGAGSGVYLMGMLPSGQAGTQNFSGSVAANTERFYFAASDNKNSSTSPNYQIGWGDSLGGFNPSARSTNLLTSPVPNNNGYMLSNTTYFIVLSYEFGGTNSGGTVTNDWERMWVDPATASFGAATPPAEIANRLIPNGTGILTNAAGWYLLSRGSGSTPTNGFYLGSMRVGSTWTYVTGGPEFTTNPASVSPAFGGTLNLSGSAVAGGLLVTNYHWQRNGVNLTDGALSDGSVVSGSATSHLTISSVTSQEGGSYTLVAGDAISSVTSAPGVVTVLDPAVSSQPLPAVTYPGGTATFSITASGSSPFTYQWQMNGSNLSDGASPSGTGATIAGSQTARLTISNAQSADNGELFTCTVFNKYNASVLSSSAPLTIADPGIAIPPSDANVNYGQTANFTVSAAGASTLSYQWQLNGNNLSDGPSPTGSGAIVSGSARTNLTLSGVTYQDAGTYTVVITDSASTATSAAVLTVNDPYISTQPAATSVLNGGTATLSVVAQGSPSLSYSWFDNGSQLFNGPTANGSTISGADTATLTVSSASGADSGNYSVNVSGPSGQTAISSNAAFTAIVPASISSIFPQTRTERVGDHLAIVVTAGGTSPFSYVWKLNGTTIPGETSSALNLSNIQTTNAGTYSVTVNNAAGTPQTASATLNVSTNLMTLSSNNLVVTRIGDGAETLNNNTGNTIYLDQFQTDGTYVNTIQVPDAPTSAWGSQSIAGVPTGQNLQLVALGAGADAYEESFLTRSTNQQYLNFAAYNETINSTPNPLNAKGVIRGIAAINALGYYQLAYTNTGLYNGGALFIRGAVSDSGQTNFWTSGAAGQSGIKYAEWGASYSDGSLIPNVSGSGPGPHAVDIVNGNLVFTDSSGSNGLVGISGLPKANGTSTTLIAAPSGTNFQDFAFSPDLQTVYICDDRPSDGTSNGGGIERWDTNVFSGGWTYNYTLAPTAGTNGASGLTVDWSANQTWGQGVNGAVVYATTAGSGNSLIAVVDNGQGSTATTLSTAGPNQMFRGLRFGPVAAPVQITAQPQDQSSFVGATVTLSVGVSGDAPFSYQWKKNGNNITGATDSSLTITNAQTSDSGSYSVTISDPLPSSATSSAAVVSIQAIPAIVVSPLQSRVETVGDHTAFVISVTGTAPFTYSWTKNGSPIGGTNSYLVLNNIQTSDSGTYSVIVNNPYGRMTNSATLQVTSTLQPLSGNNLVVARLGDGAQNLSTATGNTIYLDQIQPDGTYVNTIQIPDQTPSAIVADGGLPGSVLETVLTRSQNGEFLNFGGFNVSQPNGGSNVGAAANHRAIGAVDAYGHFSLVINNPSLYNGNTFFRSVVSSDGVTQFWTTGVAGSDAGLKYVNGNGSGIPSIAGGLSNTRVVDITPHGNLAFTDAVDSGLTGLNAITGLPTTTNTPTLVINAGKSASPNDFAISPDVGTVYIADDENFTASTGNGGIQRWDAVGDGTYALSYTLPSGGNSLGGARCLVADFNASGSWGTGVTGAIIYATTSEASTNSIVKIIDNGPGSTGTVIATAGPNQLFRGLRFGPNIQPTVTIFQQPVSVTNGVGTTATFSVGAGGGPFTYQWQLNGNNLTDGPSPSGSGAVISGSASQVLTVSNVQTADSGGNYSVIVSNPNPGGAVASSSAQLSVVFTQFGSGADAVTINPDHTVQLNFSGSAGSSYRIWGSTNVALKPVTSTWTLLTNGTFSGGPDNFVDTNAPVFNQQFYTITIP